MQDRGDLEAMLEVMCARQRTTQDGVPTIIKYVWYNNVL